MRPNHFILSALLVFFTAHLFAQNIATPAPPQGPTTKMKFDNTEFDFGQAVAGEQVMHVFILTNTGDEPLIISNAKGSCGCTVPRWPKAPIMPGESAEIFAQFNTKNKRGLQAKMITITANTDPPQNLLYIKGEVVENVDGLKEEHKAEEYIEFKLEDINAPVETVTAYPNPTSSVLNLSLKDFAGQSISIDIYNAAGQNMESRKIETADHELIQFDVSGYEDGIYSVAVITEVSGKISKQFMVVK